MPAEFAVRFLSVLAYAQGFTQWHYRSSGPLATVLEYGFFARGADMIETGDMIHVSAADGGAILFVSASTGHKHYTANGANGQRIEVEVMASTAVTAG
jgi:hypothetical protein